MNALETYLKELRDSQHAAVKETSYYGALANLCNAVGDTLRPKVRYVITPKGQGAGLPDGGLYTAQQLRRGGEPVSSSPTIETTLPERGGVEAKGLGEEVEQIAGREQVRKYLARYGQMLVTNYRDFLLVGRDEQGRPLRLERYTLAASEAEFWAAAANPQAFAREDGGRFEEYLKRVMLHAAPLAAPEDVARFLASYARDAKARMEKSDLPALASVRAALEEALGLKFVGEDGEHFFRSTLVQTIFYGVFSAWVLWTQEGQGAGAASGRKFDWRSAAWSLRVPMIRALFEQLLTPTNVKSMGLVEVLDWAGATLNRIEDPTAFIRKFTEGHAVQYFYEPFLQEFDPELRKQLGVWYTPTEIVKYMVARVDTVLREELNVADGLANDGVYVLDPCCGTGAYLVEVLRRIEATLAERGEDALAGEQLKQAAMKRVFGFEILPAPFVVAHLQLGLLLQSLGAPLSDTGAERVGVYLTNALTGWEPAKEPKTRLLFPELEEERDRAEEVKQATPILVVLGNPPYNGFAGVAVKEERELTNAYRTTVNAPPPQGQGLNDLYIRFFRAAERRIVEKTRAGVVCFISNYSWLDGLSFTGMRERYLDAFDHLWIDSLNGDKYKTGKLTPEGKPDPSVFSTEFNREGIQVGTAIATLVRKDEHEATHTLEFRHFWGKEKRAELLASLSEGTPPYVSIKPLAPLGLPFVPLQIGENYGEWPLLPELFPVSFPGVKTSRDDVVTDIDKARLVQRMEQYFDPRVSDEEMRRIAPTAMQSTQRFNAAEARAKLLKRGFLPQNIIRYCYRPFDIRWLYWEPETKLLDEKRAEYFYQMSHENIWMVTQQKPRREWSKPQSIQAIGCLDLMDRGASCVPLYLRAMEDKPASLFRSEQSRKQNVLNGLLFNISDEALKYLSAIGTLKDTEDIFHHAVAILHAPTYATENSGALRQDWPRVPLPAEADALGDSAALGRQVAAILAYDAADPTPAQASQLRGITHTPLRPEMKSFGVVSRVGGGQLRVGEGELAVNVNWGFAGKSGVMPGRGKVVERDYTPDERAAIAEGARALGLDAGEAFARLGERTLDVYLNEVAYWKNVPARVWAYHIGGYQVVKKWLSYREREVLGRDLTLAEAGEVRDMTRRLAALLLLEPALDANYQRVKAAPYAWPS